MDWNISPPQRPERPIMMPKPGQLPLDKKRNKPRTLHAAMESYFALLQKNVLNRKRWTSREQLRIEIVTRIKRTNHRRRGQAALGRTTPIGWETIMKQSVALAA